MSENALWTKVRAGLMDAADLKIDLMRVENLVQAGCPDVNYCLDGGAEGWIELKHADNPPARDTTAVFKQGGLNNDQVVWLHRRARRGGRVWILARSGLTMWLVHGKHAKVFNSWTYPILMAEAAWIHSGKGKVDWKGLLEVLG